MAVSTEAFLLVFAVIIFIGFAGSWLLSRKGIPETLFLIAAGIAVRWAGFLPSTTISALLPLLSEVTFAMVVFEIGTSMKVEEILSEGGSAVLRSTVYMSLTILSIVAAFPLLFGWGLYQSLFLAIVIGGDVTIVVVPYLAKKVARGDLLSNLGLESVYDSLVLIILFFVALSGYSSHASLDLGGLSVVLGSFASQVIIGILGGTLFGYLWLRIAKIMSMSDYFYLATVGYVLLAYAAVNGIDGSGVLAVLIVGLMIKNYTRLPPWLGVRLEQPALLFNYISAFQNEITFFLRAFFLFFLGFSVEVVSLATPGAYLPFLYVLGALGASRYLATEAVDHSKPQRDRRFIELMLAEGLTPALLATTLVANQVVGANAILSITVLVIVATNIVTTVGAREFLRHGGQGLELDSLAAAAPLVRELEAMTAGLGEDQLDDWSKRIEEEARGAAPSDVKELISLLGRSGRADLASSKELKVSRRAVPFIVAAIEKHKDSMPEGTRNYFERIESMLAASLSSKDLDEGA